MRHRYKVKQKNSPLHIQTVTGLNKWVAVWLTGGVCIFYTSLGGLKAVVWTDTFQISIMLSGFIAIIIKGSLDYGGFSNISQSYREGGRYVYDEFMADPRYRHTVWSIVVGGVVGANSYCVSQSFIQRLLACKNKKNVN